MPFDFKKYDEKCNGLTPEELQREWQHYTRLITGAATSTSISGLALPLTAGVSSIGVALGAPAIHNARKKREIVERHLNRHNMTHVTRKRDVLGGVAVSGTIGVVTLGVGSMGADAIATQGAEHGISAIVENELAVKVVTHAALDGAGLAVEHAHTNHLKKRDAKKAFQAAGVFQAVKEAKAAEAGYTIPPYNPQTWAGGSTSQVSLPPPPPPYSPGMTSTGYYDEKKIASPPVYPDPNVGSQHYTTIQPNHSGQSIPSYQQPTPTYQQPPGPPPGFYQGPPPEPARTPQPATREYVVSPQPAPFDMSSVAGALPISAQSTPATQQYHQATASRIHTPVPEQPAAATAWQQPTVQAPQIMQATIHCPPAIELPAEYSTASFSPDPMAPAPLHTASAIQFEVDRPAYGQEPPSTFEPAPPESHVREPTPSIPDEVVMTHNGFPPPPPTPQTEPPRTTSSPFPPTPVSDAGSMRRHSVVTPISRKAVPQNTQHRYSVAPTTTQFPPTPDTMSSTPSQPLPYFPPPPTQANAPAPKPRIQRPRPMSYQPATYAPVPIATQIPSQYRPVAVEPKYEAVPVPQPYQRPQSQLFPPTPMSLPTSPATPQPQATSPGYFPPQSATQYPPGNGDPRYSGYGYPPPNMQYTPPTVSGTPGQPYYQ